MKVLNLHGFDGSSQNTNYTLLKSMDLEVISPQLNYRELSVQGVMDILFSLIREEGPELIVATSYGAFFGKRLSDKFDVPCIFTNPCFRPDVSLKNIAPEYCTPSRRAEMREWAYAQRFYDFSKDFVIIGGQDEIIDHYDITIFEACGAKFYYVEDGKHQLKMSQYKDLFKNIVEEAKFGIYNREYGTDVPSDIKFVPYSKSPSRGFKSHLVENTIIMSTAYGGDTIEAQISNHKDRKGQSSQRKQEMDGSNEA